MCQDPLLDGVVHVLDALVAGVTAGRAASKVVFGEKRVEALGAVVTKDDGAPLAGRSQGIGRAVRHDPASIENDDPVGQRLHV